jgi:hypothetical protein
LIAIFSTVAEPLSGGMRAISLVPASPVTRTKRSTRSSVGGMTGRPSVTPIS